MGKVLFQTGRYVCMRIPIDIIVRLDHVEDEIKYIFNSLPFSSEDSMAICCFGELETGV